MSQSEEKKSVIAREVENLKSDLFAAERKRHPLPQPLFWSLFNHRLESIRRKKRIKDTISDLLDI